MPHPRTAAPGQVLPARERLEKTEYQRRYAEPIYGSRRLGCDLKS